MSLSVHITAYTPQYDPEIRGLIVTELLIRYPNTIQECLDDFDAYTNFFLVLQDQKLIGCGGYDIQDDVAYLKRFFISQSYRNQEKTNEIPQMQKASSLLYQHIQHHIAKSGIGSIALSTSNMYAMRFYEKNGFLIENIDFNSKITSFSKKLDYTNIAYIDAQNIHKATEQDGWIVDRGLLYEYLCVRYACTQVKYFTGYISKYQSLYTKLELIGYTLVFKEVCVYNNGSTKGNVDVDMSMHVMDDLYLGFLQTAFLFTSDSDFNTLVHRLIQEKKLGNVIVANIDRVGKQLKKASLGKMQSLKAIQHLIERQQKKVTS